jgi:hypothetical protein
MSCQVPVLVKDGTPFLNKKKEHIQTIFFSFDEDQNTGDSTIEIPSNSKVSGLMSNTSEGVIVLRYLAYTSTSAFSLNLRKSGVSKYYLCSNYLHIDTIAGKGGNSFKLPHQIVVEPSRGIDVDMVNLSNASNFIRLCFIGEIYWVDPPKEDESKTLFFYTTDQPIELPSTTEEKEAYITIEDYPYILSGIACASDGPFRLKIFSGTGRTELTNGWIHSEFLGNAEFPLSISQDILRRTSKLKLVLRNLSNATNNVYITLHGCNWLGD